MKQIQQNQKIEFQRAKKNNIQQIKKNVNKPKKSNIIVIISCLFIGFIVILITIYGINQYTNDWLKLRLAEREQVIDQMKKYETKCYYIYNIKDLQLDIGIEIRIYKPELIKKQQYIQCEYQEKTPKGLQGQARHWDYVFQKFASIGYIVVSQDCKHIHDIQKDVNRSINIWTNIKKKLLKENSELNKVQTVIIGHSYGGLISSLVNQEIKDFNTVILYCPLIEIGIDPLICLRNKLTNKSSEKCPNKFNLKQVTFDQIKYLLKCPDKLYNDNYKYNINWYMIISVHENLISNKACIKLFDKINVNKKKLIVSNKITHNAQNDQIFKIFTSILK